jgi:hypothetical protein
VKTNKVRLRRKVYVFSDLVMVQRTRVILQISRWRGKVSAFGLTAGNIRVNGLTTICTGRVNRHGLMAGNIRVNGLTT